MSQTLELPDSVYGALKKAAEESGTTPAGWIAARLGQGKPRKTHPTARTLADLFAGRIGQYTGKAAASTSDGEDRFGEHLEQKRREGRL